MLLSRFIACTFSTVPIRYLSLLLRLSAAACGLTRTVFSMTHIRLAAFDCPSVWPCLTFTWICPFILLWFRAMTVETVFRPVCFLVNFLTFRFTYPFQAFIHMGFIFIRDKGFNEAWIAHGEVDMSWAGSPAEHGFRTWHFQTENCSLLGMHAVASAGAVRNATQVGRVGSGGNGWIWG